MADAEYVAFLQRVLPRLGLRWPGFRRVRGQVNKRIARRIRQLGLEGLDAYERHVEQNPDELRHLDGLCRVTITRFGRDRGVWRRLRAEVLPRLAAQARTEGRTELCALSAGCASGEEPYTLSLLWDLDRPAGCRELALRIDACDADARLLERARAACFPAGAMKELPTDWIGRAFTPCDGGLLLREPHRTRVCFTQLDLRHEVPAGPFDLILCRNLAFTYFDEATQRRVLARLRSRLRPGGELVIGAHEQLPPDVA